jgi:hypothetical protein
MLRGDVVWVEVRGVKGVACINLIVRGVRNSTLSRRVWAAEIGFFETACTRRKVWDVGLGLYRAACMRRLRHHPPTPSRTLPPTSRRGTPPRARSLFETTQISAFSICGFRGLNLVHSSSENFGGWRDSLKQRSGCNVGFRIRCHQYLPRPSQ